MLEIIPLEEELWKGYILTFHYISYNYFDVRIELSEIGFNFQFVKTPFDKPYEKNPDTSDSLFKAHWEDVKAWGIVDNGRLVAAIETSVEAWNNRLRVTELWVDDNYRRQKIGTRLMDLAVKRARGENRRAVILETQTCNENAIAFYINYGFKPIGFDLCAYSNRDIERKESRLEMGLYL
ncbi:MAG: GNAT family N-acetyltransferase [Clostridiales bacterium]|jgi:ribosomal protein S18 acetylase RimI-like enzyme|nr:GNAT family N-acetyltransferase [Clostridiales bacterium]